jgi:hypothetical protein
VGGARATLQELSAVATDQQDTASATVQIPVGLPVKGGVPDALWDDEQHQRLRPGHDLRRAGLVDDKRAVRAEELAQTRD